jgi:hypothetical protein
VLSKEKGRGGFSDFHRVFRHGGVNRLGAGKYEKGPRLFFLRGAPQIKNDQARIFADELRLVSDFVHIVG